MKIEIDLTEIHEAPALARGAALAVMLALPEDDVFLLIRQWNVCRTAEAEAENFDGAAASAAVMWPSKADVSRETLRLKPEPESPAAPGFEFMGREFSPAKRGPSAALKRAQEVIAGCSTAAELEQYADALTALAAWFDAIGHEDKDRALTQTFAARGDDLSEPAPEAREVEGIADTLPFVAQAEPAKSNGTAEPPELAELDLRQLCRHVGEQVGDAQVYQALGRRKLSDISDAEINTVRATLVALVAN